MQEVEKLGQKLAGVRAAIGSAIYGQADVVEQSQIGLLSGGHVLLVGVPGLGKTKLVETLGRVMGLDAKRVQFTPDLMPADILGSEVLEDQADGRRCFRFLKGPIFCQLLMADEINRASPRTQSALLQAMQEGQVSIAGQTRPLPQPFHVLATQNPIEQEGTYPLPEAQLDRFMMRVSIGYPSAESEIEILKSEHEGRSIDDLQPVISLEDVAAISAQAKQTFVAPSIFDYITRITNATRTAEDVTLGCSPRASLALLKAARVRAMMLGRSYVLPSDIQDLAISICAHRLILASAYQSTRTSVDEVIRRIIKEVESPHGDFSE